MPDFNDSDFNASVSYDYKFEPVVSHSQTPI